MSREPYIIRDEAMRQRVSDLIDGLDLAKPWSVTVEPYRKKRTLSQNGLYWKWVSIIADATGNSDDDAHDALKDKFCPPREVQLGDDYRTIRSTAKLETLEFKSYMDKVYAFATAELGIMLPIPEELGR